MADDRYRLHLVGLFRFELPTGDFIVLKSRKARAILAFLALARDHTRPRTWIKDHLWSDRGPEQADASLRQCVHEVRKALGADRDVLLASGSNLALAPDRVWVDAGDDDFLAALLAENDELPELLADLDIRDAEYEHWIRDRRTWLETRFEECNPSNRATPVSQMPKTLQPCLIRSNGVADGVKSKIYNSVLQTLICKSIDDSGAVKLIDADVMNQLQSWESVAAFRLQTYGSHQGETVSIGASFTRESDGAVFSDAFRNLGPAETTNLQSFDVIDLINEAVHRAFDEIANLETRLPDAEISSALCVRALKSLTDYSVTSINKADRLIARAHEIDPRGAYLSWRGYLRTFMLGEMQNKDMSTSPEEMERFIVQALEIDNANSHVLAVAAFLRSIWAVSIGEALELAERSNKLNPSNPLGISYLGMVNSHIGNLEKGYLLGKRAYALTTNGMTRSSIGYVAMRTAACAGRFSEALRVGEELRRAMPGFVAPMRMMGLLYSELGQHERAAEIEAELQKTDPDYSINGVRAYYRKAPQMKNTALANL